MLLIVKFHHPETQGLPRSEGVRCTIMSKKMLVVHMGSLFFKY